MVVTLYGRLEGIAQGDTRFCDAGVEWTGESGNGQVMRSTEDAKCVHPDNTSRVEHSYSKVIYLGDEGVFRYQLTLHMNDGKLLRSNKVDVRTIRPN